MPKRKDDGKGFQKRRLATKAFELFEARENTQPRLAEFWFITALWLAGTTPQDIYITQLEVLGGKHLTWRFKKRIDAIEQEVEEEAEVQKLAQTMEKF